MRKQETITINTYYCDQCGKEVPSGHILIEDAWRLGFVAEPDWQVPPTRRSRRTYQFCNIRCLSKFLRKTDC